MCGRTDVISAARTVKFSCCADVLKCADQQGSILFSDPLLSGFKQVVLLLKVICCGHPVSIN